MRPRDETAKDPGAARRELRAFRALLPYLWPKGDFELRGRVMLALLLLTGAKGVNVYIPMLYKKAVDALGGDATGGLSAETATLLIVPLSVLFAYGGARVLTVAFSELRDAVFAKVAQRAIRAVALKVFEHLHGLALRYHLDRQTGGISRAIERGAKGIDFLLTFMLFNVMPTFVEIGLVCGILWALYGAWLALITFATIVAYITFTLVVTEWRLKYRREMNDMDSRANTRAVDSLLNYETVKYFSNEAHEAGRYDRALRRYERAAVWSKTTLSLVNIGQGFIIAVGLTGLMIMAANRVTSGTMTLGDFVLVNTYLIQLYMPLNFLGFVYREIKNSLTDMDAMFSILTIKAEIKDKPAARPLELNHGEVAFEHVDFCYDERRPILHDVSFTVPPGRAVAIVGPSGAGKSTISRLLFRFYDVQEGRVVIDGQDIRDVTQASLRTAIGIVPQDTVMFNDTIRYNIAYGRPGASDEEIEKAASLAHIHEFVAGLPDGYATRVGERGLKLSGGEKQRVAIARMILKNPRIILFDEATSALDSKTEKEIQANLQEISTDRTTLIIAHRLSTVIHADEILVLEQGRIVERGTHAALLAAQGQYAAMWARQQEVDQLKQTLDERLAAEAGEP